MTVEAVRPDRPVQVRVALWLQLAAIVLLLGLAGLVAAYAVHYNDVITEVAARYPDEADTVSSERTGNVASALLVGIPALILAVWYAATLRPLWRGSNVARILVFVAGGGLVLMGLSQVCGGGFPLALIAFAFDDNGFVDGPDGDQGFLDALYSRTDTFAAVAMASGIGGLLLVVALSGAVVLLLALPPAHRYFVPRVTPPPAPFGYFPHGPYMICPDPSAHLPQAAAPEPPTVP
ncbi:hypothetical protein [Dactylosporangium sp. CA-139066]|uniref:hypothetical protein n=1 Tax=Dactylosporangium sp. CA-139066 TaxID=3239930 RepID=UPI003D8A0070